MNENACRAFFDECANTSCICVIFFVFAAAHAHSQTHRVGSWAAPVSNKTLFSSLESTRSDAAPQIAFTFDDLPVHGPLPPGESRLDVATKIIAAMRDAHMPATYGFVNNARVQEDPGNASVLEAWRASGNLLANHGWSHMNLNQHSLEDYEADITRNEPLLHKLMGDNDWHWYRYPFLAEGDTAEKRDAIRNFLAKNGYKIAAVTMSFGDYLWNEPYARCMEKHDSEAITLLKNSYLAAADDNLSFYRKLAHTLYGRDIPYVLLMHIGALDAEVLPQLLSLYRSRGVQFVSLQDAESDSFYRVDINPALPAVPDMLEGVMAERHLPLPEHAVSNPPFEGMCR